MSETEACTECDAVATHMDWCSRRAEMVEVPRATLEAYAKSGVNNYHGFSTKCCPVCGWDGLYAEAADKDKHHTDECWLGLALAVS